MKLLFLNRLCQIQSPQKPITTTDKQELAKLSETIRKISADGKKFVGREIISAMSHPDWKKRGAIVNIAQRLDSFCSHFSIGSIFYLVDILDQDKK